MPSCNPHLRPPVVLLHEPLEDENNNTSKLAALQDRARPCVPRTRLTTTPVSAALCMRSCRKPHVQVHYGRCTRAEVHESTPLLVTAGCHVQRLDAFPTRRMRNVCSSRTLPYKVSACPLLRQPTPVPQASSPGIPPFSKPQSSVYLIVYRLHQVEIRQGEPQFSSIV
jgi:hypothetical protein